MTYRKLLASACFSLLFALTQEAGAEIGHGAYHRGGQYRAEQNPVAQQETVESLQGQVLITPIIVKGEKTTVARNNLFVNQEKFVSKEEELPAALVTMVCPPSGRIVFQGNRFINRGEIIGKDSDAAMAIVRCQPGQPLSIESVNNSFINLGLIESIK